MQQRSGIAGEVWGGVSAMLVALPSAIAFGVTILAPLGGTYAARGAIAGILGATAIGLVAPVLGGTNRLISAPCAPAAAVLSAVAIGFSERGVAPETALLLLGAIVILTGLLQIAFGIARLGLLIKYMPYPVVSGYLSGVGLIIILSQLPKLLGAPHDAHFWRALTTPYEWQWHAITVGVATIGAMLVAPRLTKAVPATIVGLVAGVATYFLLAIGDRSLLTLAGNTAVVGQLGVQGGGVVAGIVDRFTAFRGFDFAQLGSIVAPALTLSVLLSIDTLKTCVVIDALTRSRHNSNRELIAQGCANIASTLAGGVPGAGTMGATLVNISGGAHTRLSGTIEGGAALLAFVALGSLLAWIPIAALAGVLIVVGVRMFDRNSLELLASRATRLDFAVIVAVVVVAETVSLIAASAVGVGLAILLFIREQAHTTIVWRRMLGNQLYSKQVRVPAEMRVLEEEGVHTAILELQGSLFFGTADRLYTEIEPELNRMNIILDFGRVQSVDVTAVHVLEQIEDTLREKGGALALARVPRALPNGTNVALLLRQSGLLDEGRARMFTELDGALEWSEDQALTRAHVERDEEEPLTLRELALFRGRKAETFSALEACAEQRHYEKGVRVFSAGDTGDELYLIRRGTVRIELPIGDTLTHHVATFGRGDFFGELAFLDHQPRSAHAIAERDSDIYVIPRSRFDTFASEHRHLALNLVEGLAHTLAMRLRRMNVELRALEDG